MLRRMICLLWAVCMVMGTGGRARAAERTGSVRIMPQWCGTPVTGGMVSVRRVGGKCEKGFYITDGLANWQMDAAEWNEDEGMIRVAQKNAEQVLTAVADEEGAFFSGLEEGIYLVQQLEENDGYFSFAPFLISIPEGENWDVCRSPKVISQGESPRTVDHPAPIVGAMGIGFSVAVLMVLADNRKK